MRPLFFASLLFPLFSISALHAQESHADVEASFKLHVPALLTKHNVPGVAIGIIRNGKPDDLYFYGIANKKNGILVDKHTTFNVGSISKTLTAWGIMHLLEQGKIDLDQPVENYISRWKLPPSEFDTKGVTIRRLLNHTAGLAQWAVPQYESGESIPPIEDVLTSGENSQGERAIIVYAPGTNWRYSGGGYTLLQLLIEEVSGQKYTEFMEQEILKPLGMQDSSFDLASGILEHTATAYDEKGNATPLVRFRAVGAAGLHTSAGDLLTFAVANLPQSGTAMAGRGVLKPETIDQMTRTSASADSADKTVVNRNYGFGYFVIAGEPRFFGHGGDNRGWHARFLLYPDTNSGFVVLTNSSNGFAVAEAINCLLAIELANAPEKTCD
jgi:CubicO group peptidase (beta-lactamase class C family)